eukprot:Tamp_16933.p1 GENE.Tamp_16933~~Tamp_16933.p1  ORF type:complete len:475 (+),score=103.16 Tamp_16933:68-1426(+)
MEVERLLHVECEPRTLVAVDPSKRHFVTTLEDGKVHRWSLQKGRSDTLRGHLRRATCAVFSPRSDLLCTGSFDNTLRLWNMDGCECIGTLEGHEDEITCAAFDPRGRMVCSGSADRSLKLWRVVDGRSQRAYKGLSATASSVAFRPEGANGRGAAGQGSLVCGGEDGIMWLLDAAKAGRPKRLKGHTTPVRRLQFHPLDTHVLMSSSDDGSLRSWNTETGQCLQVLATDASRLLDFGFVPSSGHLLLATLCRLSVDKTQSQISKLARSTFGFLAKSAGGDKLASRMKAEDANTLLNFVLVSFDSETGSFSNTLAAEGIPLRASDVCHTATLTPDCEMLCSASHKRVNMFLISHHAVDSRQEAGMDDVVITILPGGDTDRVMTSEDASVDETARASSEISEVLGEKEILWDGGKEESEIRARSSCTAAGSLPQQREPENRQRGIRTGCRAIPE